MSNLVAIVGRPNVGKSSLFNMIVGKRDSIVHNKSGVTRDRLYGFAKWSNKKFQIIDTGGIQIENKPFQKQIAIQTQIAIEEAIVIIFLVDGKNGLTSDDHFVAKLLRSSQKPILLVANKLEGNRTFISDLYTIGIKDIFAISATHGDGIGDLLDKVISYFDPQDPSHRELTKLAIIGRPNVGKSSLLNAITGKERSIISPIPGTTRDAINAKVRILDHEFLMIDTAGINRKSKLVDTIEHYALSRAKQTIKNANLIIFMIDNEKEIFHFDQVVGGYIYEQKKPVIIVVNKWDLATKKTMTMDSKEHNLKKFYQFLQWAPIVFISAKTKLRLDKLKQKIVEVNTNRLKKIKTQVFNEVVNEIQIVQPAQSYSGGRLNIKFARQEIKSEIPKFFFWVNNKKYLHFTYLRFLEKKIRDYFGFVGTPMNLVFKNSKGNKYE